MITLDVLVIGAGMSGLVAASQLSKSGLNVQCVEKARGSGGRLSSKRVSSEVNESVISFDLDCASFTASSELFRSQVESWIQDGLAKIWHYSDERGAHYVPVPRSSSLTRSLADHLPVHFATRISSVEKHPQGWMTYIEDAGQQVPFSLSQYIIFATPPQQAADLLPSGHAFKAPLSEPILLPQWVLMLYIKGHLDLNEPYYEFEDLPISKLILEQSKPERLEQGSHQIWVIHASTDWTAEHLDTEKDKVARQLMSELAGHLGAPLIVDQHYLHRWLYSQAQVHSLSGKSYLEDGEGLWFCGDYLAETDQVKGVEAAFTSANILVRNFPVPKI